MISQDQDAITLQMRSTKIIFAAIAGAIAVTIITTLFVNQVSGALAPELVPYTKVMIGVIAVISFGAMVLAKTLYNKDIRFAKETLISDLDKLTRHRSALIKYMAVCELPAVLGAILFLLTGNFVFLVFSAVLLGFVLVMAPSAKKLTEELALDWTHRDNLN